VLLGLRRKAVDAGADWEVCVLELGLQITEFDNVSAFTAPRLLRRNCVLEDRVGYCAQQWGRRIGRISDHAGQIVDAW
jgi:hypothetical protein